MFTTLNLRWLIYLKERDVHPLDRIAKKSAAAELAPDAGALVQAADLIPATLWAMLTQRGRPSELGPPH
jgi:hypothetical protein